MFKTIQRRNRQSPQNPISDMEQFYLHQYFYNTGVMNPTFKFTPPPPSPHQNNYRFPPIEFARFHQLEQRVARIEQYLGLSNESRFNTIKR